MKFSNKILSQTITEQCIANEINQVVISPGSRNAPLIIGFTENPDFNCFSIVDERCAAFFALGLAQQSKKPVALVCTSGSALLNYYPAIAEAFYSDIPLLIISADRPHNLLEIGDGQTIRQENVFTNHILFSGNCIEDATASSNAAIINQAISIALLQQGPVHINAPFSEPLYEYGEESLVIPLSIETSNSVEPIRVSEDLEPFIKEWNSFGKKIIIVGVLAPDSIEQRFLDFFAADESVIVLTEVTSNLHHEYFFPAIDQLIAPLSDSEFQELRPDILLTFGGMVVSKKIKAFFRTHSPKRHWHVDVKKAYDTYFCLDHHFKVCPNDFLNEFLAKAEKVSSTYRSVWLTVRNKRRQQSAIFEKAADYSDFKVYSEIFKTLPENTQVQLSNSAAIRYAQLFDLNKSLHIFCNRGTSGIDGSLSTAIGAAYASTLPTVFITGDLSFLYDSNGLWNNYIPATFRIIIINNGGGGIFRILPGAKDTEHFTNFFETKHSLNARHLSEMYSIEYASASNLETLKLHLAGFYITSERPKLLEIFTPSEANDLVLKKYFQFLK